MSSSKDPSYVFEPQDWEGVAIPKVELVPQSIFLSQDGMPSVTCPGPALPGPIGGDYLLPSPTLSLLPGTLQSYVL